MPITKYIKVLQKHLNYVIRKLKNKKMKQFIILIFFALSIFSCKKEEVCNCGLVVRDNVADYSVVIRNSCTGNEKRFVLSPGDWMNAYVGSNYCITNVSSW